MTKSPEAARVSAWQEFQHDTNVATQTLLYLLSCIHAIHEMQFQMFARFRDESGGDLGGLEEYARVHGDMYTVPPWPRLRVFPWVKGESLHERAGPDGPMEQHVFRAWVVEIYGLWENRYRNELKRLFREEMPDTPGLIRPEQDVIGDLRHIRNNLIHGGVAKRGEAASCKILEWFREGEQMRVRLPHVLDFLNQMDWLTEHHVTILEPLDRPRSSSWKIHADREPAPGLSKLVSTRPLVMPEAEEPKYRYAVSVAFEDGVFGRIPMGPADGIVSEPYKRWEEIRIDEAGNLRIPGAAPVLATDLYSACMEAKTDGPNPWSRWTRFRR